MENIHPKILAIDIINSDLPALKTTVSQAFPNAELRIAQNANEGLKLCHFEKPDVVLLDISRSEMNGFEICSKIKSENSIKHIPVLMITAARTEKESRIKALEVGADAFLTQPMDELELFAQIKAMIRIKESEAKEKIKWLTMATDQCPVGIMLIDPEGCIEYVNSRLMDLTGYERSELIGKNLKDIYFRHADSAFLQKIINTILSGQEWSGELRNKNKNGTPYWERIIVSPVLSEEGEIVHHLVIKVDISEKKKILTELIIARKKAEEGDRLKTSFLNSMSHEVRTPLSAIMGFTSLLMEPELSQEDRMAYCGFLNRSSNQLLCIMDNIIQIATIEAGQEKLRTSEIDLHQIFADLYHQFKEKEKPGELKINYELHLPEHDLKIIADGTKLIQILTNLISNALKFTETGEIEFCCELKNENLHFWVRDTGPGILKEYQQIIFERFRQFSPDNTKFYGGNGLGLAISKAYVELMGGNIWVESEPGKGSVFHFTIPHHPILPAKKIPDETFNPEQNIATSETILMAEDEWANFYIVERMLKKLNYLVIHVDNGKKAVEACRKNQNIDLVLMDLKMPIMDGYEATRILKEEFPSLPIIALSAYALNENKKKAMEAGCVDFIEKPVVKEQLLLKIKEHLKPR